MTLNNAIQITDLGASHKYRHELPNIVDEMGLDPYEYRVYGHYKRIAGDSGDCFRSNTRLAKECGMGLTKFKQVKARLAEPFEVLGGKPLIEVTSRMTDKGDPDTDWVTIIDIWPDNMRYISEKYNTGGSPRDRGVGRHATGGGSPRDHKEEPFKKNPLKNNNNKEEELLLSSLDELELEEAYKRELIKGHADKIPLLIKRVLRWKDRSSDTKACGIILRSWETWDDTPSRDEKQEAVLAETRRKQDIAAERKQRALAAKKKNMNLPWIICDNRLEIKNGKGFVSISWMDDDIENLLKREETQ